MAVVLLWLRKGCSCHIFLAENKVYWCVSVYVRNGGVCTTLSQLQKSRPQKFVVLFQKSRFQNTLSPCTENVFMLKTVPRKSLKCQFHIWGAQKGQAGSRQQKQQLYSPDFLLLISKEQQEPCPPNRGPRASPPATLASFCFGEEIKIMWVLPLCLRSHNVTLRLHSSTVPAWENTLIPCEKCKPERLTPEKLQKSKFPLKWVGALPVIYWIGQFSFQIVTIFWKKSSFHVRQEPAFSKIPASLMSPKYWCFDNRDIIP